VIRALFKGSWAHQKPPNPWRRDGSQNRGKAKVKRESWIKDGGERWHCLATGVRKKCLQGSTSTLCWSLSGCWRCHANAHSRNPLHFLHDYTTVTKNALPWQPYITVDFTIRCLQIFNAGYVF